MIKAVRNSAGEESSNVVWDYGHTTIPRHLRDIVINEYSIADLRGASDKHVVAEILSITDSQFQNELLVTAKAKGKIAKDFTLKSSWADNSRSKLQQKLQSFKQDGLLPDYPFGTDFTELEQHLIPALEMLKDAAKSKMTLLKLVMKGIKADESKLNPLDIESPKRLKLEGSLSIQDKITRLALLGLWQKLGLWQNETSARAIYAMQYNEDLTLELRGQNSLTLRA